MSSGKNASNNELGAKARAASRDAHVQHSVCKAFVATHEVNDRYPGGENGLSWGQYDLTNDIISMEYEETFGGQSCSLTLVPGKPYQEIIFPGDWISVYLGTGGYAPEGFGVLGRSDSPTDNDRILVGFIDSVKVSMNTGENGKTSVRVLIHCSGVQKAFDRTSIYYNENLGPETLFGAQLPGLSLVTKNVPLIGTPATIPRAIALAFMGFGGQFVLPDNYPTGVGTERDRSKRLLSFLDRAKELERDIGILNVRGTGGGSPQRDGLVQDIWKKHKDKVQSNALTSIVDLFTHVEDDFVDGRITNSPTHDLTGSVWSKMIENSNPMMNECFFTMLPTGLDELGSREDKDEWGQSPKYSPSLVIREKPFSWVDETFELPSVSRGVLGSRKVHFGNVFFSSILNPMRVAKLQRGVIPAQPVVDLDSMAASIIINDVTGLTFDKIEEIRKLSAQKSESTFAMFQRLGVESGQGSSVIPVLEKRLLAKEKLDDVGFGVRYIDRVQIRTSDIRMESIGIADNDVFNFFMMSAAKMPIANQKYVFLQDGLVPIFLPESIKRYGLRVREISSKYGNAGGVRIDSAAVQDFFARSLLSQDLWYQHNASYRAGTFTVPGMPKAHVGMALDISSPRNETYYIEGVTHSWNHPGRLDTSFTVTRGQPSGDMDTGQGRFKYAPPDPVNIIDTHTGKTRGRVPEPPQVQPTYITHELLNDNDIREAINNRAEFNAAPGVTPPNLSRVELEGLKAIAAREKKNILDYLLEIKKINDLDFVILKELETKGRTRRVRSGVETKEDRRVAGRIAWIQQSELAGKMWDPIRRLPGVNGGNSGAEKAASRALNKPPGQNKK